MPAGKFKIYPSRKLVSIQWNRVPSVQDWYEVLEAILGHPDYQRGMNFLTSGSADARNVTPAHVSEVLSVFERRADRITPASFAVLAPSSYDFGMARMMEILSERAMIVVRAFKRPREAIEWLRNPVRYEYPAERVFA